MKDSVATFGTKRVRKHFGTTFNLESVRRTITSSDGKIIKLVTEANKYSKLPCVWESGGSFGVEAFAYGILDRRYHTMKPNIVNRNSTTLEMRQAQHTVWNNCFLITGSYIKKSNRAKVKTSDSEVMVRLYKMKEFASEDIASDSGFYTRHYAVFELVQTQSYETLELFKNNLVNLKDMDTVYMITPDAYRQNISNIIGEKLFGFFNQEPLLSKRWMCIDQKSVPSCPAFNETDTTIAIDSGDLHLVPLKTTYDKVTGAAWERSVNNFDRLKQYAKLEVRPRTDTPNGYDFTFTLDDGVSSTTTLNINDLKMFWFPDHDPWSERDLEFLKTDLALEDTESNHTLVKYYRYVG